MLITCDGCNTKIRVPDSAAGKRVKCPKCATLIRVPELEPTSESANPESAGVSSTPLPPAPEPIPEPAKEKAAEATDGTGVTSTPSSSGSKPPPIKKSSSAAWDKDDEDDDDRDKKRSKRDDDDGEEDDDDRRKTRRKRDDDDDGLDVRNKRRGRKGATTNSLALTSMIMGIVAAVFALPACWPGCCCLVPNVIAIITGGVAVTTGFMGKGTPGSESFALTGIICGFVGIGAGVLGGILYFVLLFFQIGVRGMQGF